MKKLMVIFLFFSFYSLIPAKWGVAPQNWGDFQIGLNSRPGATSATEMKTALAAGNKLNRRYVYANSPEEIFPDGANAFLFTSWRNYAKETGFFDKGVRPTYTVYMLQHGQDGLEAVKSGAADQPFMKKYFDALIVMLDSSKGTQPLYVIEPDVWGYLLQGFESTLGEQNLNSICHLNDLGFSWLSEFQNTLRDLPKAIIKTIRMRDPQAYSGILLAHWAYNPTGWGDLVNFTPEQISTAASKGAEFVNKLLGTTYRGDFIGVEKNGAAAGWYEVSQGTQKWYWTDVQNANWLHWATLFAKTLDLPLMGWQISAGYSQESGYTALPNTANRYKDTFFPYFFKHVNDFINAGFIGLMLGSEDRGVGTICTINDGQYDNGYFYDQLVQFDKNRPYDLNLPTSINTTIPHSMVNPIEYRFDIQKQILYVSTAEMPSNTVFSVSIYSPKGDALRTNYHSAKDWISIPFGSLKLSSGIYMFRVAYGSVEKVIRVPMIR